MILYLNEEATKCKLILALDNEVVGDFLAYVLFYIYLSIIYLSSIYHLSIICLSIYLSIIYQSMVCAFACHECGCQRTVCWVSPLFPSCGSQGPSLAVRLASKPIHTEPSFCLLICFCFLSI